MKPFHFRGKKVLDTPTFFMLIPLSFLALLMLLNSRYGFHRDELAFLDNGRHLAWGFVEYPPVTPFLAAIALRLFGPTLFGIRFFAALAVSIVMLLTGFMARELGGSLKVQVISAFAAVTAPFVLFHASFFSYDTFDYLWWVLTAFMLIKLLKSENPCWWLGIGATIGLGLMTKYTILSLIAGIAVGVIVTPARRYLKSPWFWSGVALSFVIILPNLVWQVQHHFISLAFINSIHIRDMKLGRTNGFLSQQLYVCANIAALFFWISGFSFYMFSPTGRPYRLIGWMSVVSFVLLFLAKGRYYYPAPLYPMLIAAGTVLIEKRFSSFINNFMYIILLMSGIIMILLVLPMGQVNSSWWNISLKLNSELREEIGWPDLVETIAHIRSSLPEKDQAHVGILTGNYGEAGAVNLYGPAYGLPEAISGVNTYWLRDYPNPPPEVLIVIGFTQQQAEKRFTNCRRAGHVSNPYGVMNEETLYHPDIFVCGKPRQPWPEFWKSLQSFG